MRLTTKLGKLVVVVVLAKNRRPHRDTPRTVEPEPCRRSLSPRPRTSSSLFVVPRVVIVVLNGCLLSPLCCRHTTPLFPWLPIPALVVVVAPPDNRIHARPTTRPTITLVVIRPRRTYVSQRNASVRRRMTLNCNCPRHELNQSRVGTFETPMCLYGYTLLMGNKTGQISHSV